MQFSLTIYLVILVLFSLSLLDQVKADIHDDDDDVDEEDYLVNMIHSTHNTTTVSVPLEDESEETEDYPLKSKTTTTTKKSATSHHHDDVDYYTEDRDEYDDVTDLTKTTKLLTSSSKEIKFSTTSTTEVTTTTTKTTVTRSVWTFSSGFYTGSFRWWTTTTIDPAIAAAYIAKINRDRLYLKIFTITVSVGMLSLAIALITIHTVRKTRRYHGYGVPANKQSKQLNSIAV